MNVAPLEGTDAAQLFLNAVSRPLTWGEVGIAPGLSHEALLNALLGHLEEAKGHPATLVRDVLPGGLVQTVYVSADIHYCSY